MRFNLGNINLPGLGIKRTPPLKERIAEAIYRLDTQRTKLEETSAKLHKRDREMFERCIGAEAAHDSSRAVMYANECVEIRKMAKIVLASQLALERVSLRLQTIEDFGDLLIQMAPVVGIVKETRGRLAGVIPEVAYELEEINSMLNNTITETGNTLIPESTIEAASGEAKKVLEEASAIAEQKMNEIYPELPYPETDMKGKPTTEQPLPATPQDQLEEEIDAIPIEELEKQVLNFIKEHGGELNLNKCAANFKVNVDDVKKAVEKLESSGKIIIK